MIPKVWSQDWNVSPEKLLEMQILWPYPRFESESEPLGRGPRISVLTNSPLDSNACSCLRTTGR